MTPLEKAKALAADLNAVLKKHNASSYIVHKELDDTSVSMTIRILPSQAKGAVSPDKSALVEELGKE